MKTEFFWYCDLDLYKNAFGGKSAPCPLAFAGYPYAPVAHDKAGAYYRYYGYGIGYRHGYY